MKELVIISGKGGTGKTSIVSSLAALAENKVLVDCDVDAADLHLILNPEIVKKENFYSGKTASINKEKCIECGKCLELCRYNSISDDFIIDKIKCEGCGVCVEFCPEKAIDFNENLCGEWYISDTRFGKMVHAKLGIAEENSGKLVALIRNQARLVAKQNNNDLIIVDGSPGIGCPVIASISGADIVLVVTEPTLSGLHDLERVVELTKHFNIKSTVCVNKYDINIDITNQIKNYCKANNIDLIGKISYDREFVEAQVRGLSIVEFSDNNLSKEVKEVWEKINKILNS